MSTAFSKNKIESIKSPQKVAPNLLFLMLLSLEMMRLHFSAESYFEENYYFPDYEDL